ncbi:MAG TPA: hypothetical protein EYH22_03505 [Candidatus Nanopusillus sp.]|nr:hypothetical protein [Candidatus Nanopusillus sp.]
MARGRVYNIYTTNYRFKLELYKDVDQDYILFVFELKNDAGEKMGTVELKIDRKLFENKDLKEILKHCINKVR